LLRAGLRRLGTMTRELMYIKSGIDVTVPESIVGNISRRCNYKCQYCWCPLIEDHAADMSIKEWQQVLLSLKGFIGRYVIQFAGGEPFIKKGFVSLLEFCQHHDIDWGAITNGSIFSDAIVTRVVAAKPLNIDISVDSPDPLVHDFVRGVPGSLDVVGNGIQRLRQERERTGRNFPIRIKPTVTRLNFRSLPRLVEWAEVHGADTIDFHPVNQELFWTPEMKSDLWPHEEEIGELRGVIETLVELKRNGAPIETPAEKLRSYPDQFLRRVVRTSIGGPCRVGMRRFTIYANGDVAVCWGYPPIGNVRTHSARKIWRSARARAIRAQTLTCPELGKLCANGCLDARSLLQEVRRAILMVRRGAL
jgi:radical SAM protein with 4Fe4S-binding SPASM domain